jgi:hypothetical protein
MAGFCPVLAHAHCHAVIYPPCQPNPDVTSRGFRHMATLYQ